MSILSANRRTVPEIPDVQAVSDGPCIRIPRSVFSINGFRKWVLSEELPEKLRVTYVDGEIYLDMSKEELQTHAFAKAEVARVLMNLNWELKLGQFYLDGVLVSNKAAGVSNNPDAVFIKWETLEKARAKLTPRRGKQGQFMEIEGSPDWVLEIVSDSSRLFQCEFKLIRQISRMGLWDYTLETRKLQ